MRQVTSQQLLRLSCVVVVIFAVSALSGYIDSNNVRSKGKRDNSALYNIDETVSELSSFGSMLQNMPVQCQTFDDGYSRMSGLSDAIYAQGNSSLCTPGGGAGTCRKWFGRCTTVGSTRLKVFFRVHDNADANQTGLSDAVYMNKPDLSCIPDGTSTGNCKRWFGLPQTQDGRPVTCRLFNDGYTNITTPTRSIYYKSPGKVCMPDGSPEGTCRKWFGRCEVAPLPPPPTCTTFTYGPWSACQSNGTQTRAVLTRSPSGCTGGQPVTTHACQYSPNGPERCFGAVGPQCDGAPGAPRVNLQNGLVRMKVSVGSIAHDTCCARNPDGKWCGKYQEIGHNGQCDKEWNILQTQQNFL